MSEVGVGETLQLQSRFAALTASDPTPAFVIKSLLHPLLAVGSLGAAVSIWGQRFDGPYLMLAVLAFVAAAELLKLANRANAAAQSHPARALLRLALRWGLFVAFLGVLLHVSQMDHLVQPRVLLTWAAITPLALWFGEQTVHRLLTRATSQAGPTRKAVILGLTELGLRLKRQLEHDPLLHIKVVGFFDERSPNRLPAEGHSSLLGSADELKDYVRREDIKLVYITLPVAPRPKVLELIDALQDSTASIYFVPDMFTCDLIQARLDVIGGIPIVAVRESPFYGAGAIAKRMTDVFLAVPLLLLAAPLLLVVAAGVRLDSPGPVLFKQRRYGLDGREIVVYKFRSLSVTEDGRTEYTQVTRGDLRLTRFGAFIRRTSLDELPQLFNVLEGTLSLVGPRPHAIAVNEQFRKLIPGYMLRHKVKPGITGLAQVKGFRGGDDLPSMKQRIQCDLDYLRNWSLTMDLQIILQTVALVWRDRRAY
jgi:putative colanic acid biosysnthesis UDP-glucose lipid carrier transferase